MYLCGNTSRAEWQLSAVAGDSLNAMRVLIYELDDKPVGASQTLSF